jgi:hypothetical protein
MKKMMLKTALNDMVDIEYELKTLLLLAIEKVEFEYEGEDSRSTMDEGMQYTKAFIGPFQRIKELEVKLAALRALVKEYKAKIAKLNITAQQNIVSVVLINN